MSLQMQYLTDQKGNKNSVLLSLKDWEKIKRDLEDYERLKDKKTFFKGLTNSFYEVELILKGKKNLTLLMTCSMSYRIIPNEYFRQIREKKHIRQRNKNVFKKFV